MARVSRESGIIRYGMPSIHPLLFSIVIGLEQVFPAWEKREPLTAARALGNRTRTPQGKEPHIYSTSRPFW